MSESEEDVELLDEVELTPLSEIHPYENNPKQHPDEQVEKIAQSIVNNNFDVPIVVDGSGEIIKGHGRYAAAKQLNLDRVPVIWRDGMTPEDVTAARIADNKTQMESGFDYDALGSELEQLDEQFDIDTESISEQTGFDQTTVDDLTTDDTPDADELFDYDGDEDEDESEPSEEPVSDDTDESDKTAEDESADDPDAETPDTMTYTCPDCGHSFEAER